MTCSIREFFWPILEGWAASELSEIRHNNRDDIEAIQSTDWKIEQEFAVEEARRIHNEEEERRKTAEAKATNLLVVTGALVPLLTYLATAGSGTTLTSAPKILTLPLLAIGICYLGATGLWALRTIKVGSYTRVYPTDLVEIWKQKKDVHSLVAKELFSATRLNQETVNSQVSALKMAHEFLFRSVIALGLLLLFQVGYEFWQI